MSVEARRARKVFRIGNGVVALAASAVLLGVLGAGFGGVPPLGSGLVPGHGAWRPASRAMLLSDGAPSGLRSVPLALTAGGDRAAVVARPGQAGIAHDGSRADWRLARRDWRVPPP